MQIEMLSVAAIKPYEKNAKKHPPLQVERIAKSIEEFGFQQPVVVDRNNVLIIGHGRFAAAQQLGMSIIPAVRADDLTDEQVNALRLIDNKVAESAWDFDMLHMELDGIETIDMTDFGFELFDHDAEKAKTQDKKANILQLNLAQFDGVGTYDIPELEPVKKLPPIKEWIGFNYVMSDKEPEGKAVHFFIDDYQFERIWNNPEKYVEKLSKYVCVATPDFSPYSDMPLACQIYNHYRKHWVGKFLQERGVTVVPTIRASRDERSLKWYLEGEPRGGIVIISSMWTADEGGEEYFKTEYNTMYETLKPKKVFMYGKQPEWAKGKIEHINTFAEGRWGNGKGE